MRKLSGIKLTFWPKLLCLVLCLFSVISLLSAQNNDSLIADKQDVQMDFADPGEKTNRLLDKVESSFKKDAKQAILYLDRAFLYENKVADSVLLRLYDLAGQVYFDQMLYHISLEYFQKQQEVQNRIEPNKAFLIYKNIGDVHLRLEDNQKARGNYNLFLDESHYNKTDIVNNSDERMNVYNSLAVLESGEGNYAKAMEMFQDYKDYAIQKKDTLGIIIAYMNISNIYVKLDDTESALKFMDEGMRMASKFGSTRDYLYLLFNKGYLYYEEMPHKKDSALYLIQKTFDEGLKYEFKLLQLESSKLLTKMYQEKENYREALHYLSINKELSEEMLNSDNIKEITRLELEYQFNKKREASLQKQKRKEFFFIIGGVLLLLISVLLFLLFRLQRIKTSKKIIENEALEKQVRSKNKELTGKVMHMLQKTELINQTTQNLMNIRKVTKGKMYSELTTVINDLQSERHGLNWEEFEKLFVETFQSFYKNLLADFPDLTQNDIRLCAFLKMNLNSKEISSITRQSINTIVVARSRLRKKMNIPKEQQSISAFLSKY